MGRTEPSIGLPPAAFRKDARAKKARATLNKLIPSLLSAHPRAKRGIDASELIVDPPPPPPSPPASVSSRAGGKGLSPDAPAAAAATTPRIVLQVTDTLTAAHALLADPATGAVDRENRSARVGVLNMASALTPGGGFLHGAVSQEEALCLRTTLLPGLRDGFYRLPEVGAVYTPDVLVFRRSGGGGGAGAGAEAAPPSRDLLAKRDRWFVDCLSAAALRFPDVAVDPATGRGAYADPADRGRVRRQMRAVLRLAAARRRRRLVLGAWGCAAPHGHPVGEVAAAWRAVLLGSPPSARVKKGRGGGGGGGGGGESWPGIDTVVFAIPDPGLAAAFATAFGEGLVREDVGAGAGDDEGDDADDGGDGGDGDDDGDDVEARRMRELRDKIAEMQTRVQQAKSPHLQAGLRAVLQNLEAQLPPRRGAAARPPGSDDEDPDDEDEDVDEDDMAEKE